MEKLELRAGDSLDTAVKMLLKAKAESRSVFCDFNGIKLYSDNVTIDSAYTKICGCTKAEWDERLRKKIEESNKKMEEDRKIRYRKYS